MMKELEHNDKGFFWRDLWTWRVSVYYKTRRDAMTAWRLNTIEWVSI